MTRHLIAILRGIEPAEAGAISTAIIKAGIDRIEVPLNSPAPYTSIEIMLKLHGHRANIGAGTVLTTAQVEKLADIGCNLVVSPNSNVDVIKATKAAGMQSIPGVMTPTESFAALEAGADALKLFPSFAIGTEGLSALRAVLPANTDFYAVGGVDANNFSIWVNAGVTGFGIGSALYKPGYTPSDVASRATSMVEAYDGCIKHSGE